MAVGAAGGVAESVAVTAAAEERSADTRVTAATGPSGREEAEEEDKAPGAGLAGAAGTRETLAERGRAGLVGRWGWGWG